MSASRWRKTSAIAWLIAMILWLGPTPIAYAQSGPAPGSQVGVQERLGTTLDLDAPLTGEDGKGLVLRDLTTLPTLLLFVYYRCPGICDPLLRELARNLDQVKGEAGVDFQVVTISFDPTETAEIAKTKKAEILATMKRPPRPSGWRFLTAEPGVIKSLTDAVGFGYQYDADTQTYVHASSLIFLTTQGKIVGYMGGLTFLPAQIELALHDASEGRERSFMKSLERLCYAYDPKGRAYVLQVNRLILALTGVFVLAFIGYLTLRRRRPEEGVNADG